MNNNIYQKNYSCRDDINNNINKYQYFNSNIRSKPCEKLNNISDYKFKNLGFEKVFKKNKSNYKKKKNYSDFDPLNLLKNQNLNQSQLIEKYISLKNLYNPEKGGNLKIYNQILEALRILNFEKLNLSKINNNFF